MTRARRDVLVTWHSQRAGAEVLPDTVRLLRSKGVRIAKVVYLVQSGDVPIPDDIELQGIQVDQLVVKLRDPTNHREIYDALVRSVVPRLQSVEGASVHVNVSPGTPAAHAVWLVLHAAGALPNGTRLWSSQKVRETKESRIAEVDFPLTTWLAEMRRLARATPGEAQYDPECHSPVRRAALENLQRFARLPRAPLLILGERGTGKTRLVERWITRLKGREKFIPIACGTLTPSLAMSALFGHLRGAFTGADVVRKGAVEEANGGVLFLDEVQDLPKEVQRQLVRFLQDPHHRYARMGETHERSADVEVVCASHRDMDSLAEALDADFLDRISLLSVEIPPLRDCREDIREDWTRVWREMRPTEELPEGAPWSSAIERALTTSELRGNLRDLQRLALMFAACSRDGRIDSETERAALDSWKRRSGPTSQALRNGREPLGTWEEELDAQRGDLARRAVDRHGSLAAAATALDVSERTLRRALKGGR